MYFPSLDQIRRIASQGNLVPIYREINADLETPVTAYLKVARRPYSFLLESAEGGERLARYSFIGTEPTKIIKTGANEEYGPVDPLGVIEDNLKNFRFIPVEGLPRFHGGAVGYFSFSGNMDTALVLRTGIYKDGVMYIQAGGGVVADSIAEDEYMETRHKSGALLRAIDLAEGLE